MKFSRNELKASFEVGISSHWGVHFTGNDSYNLIKGSQGSYFPAISVKFNYFEPVNTEIEVANGFKFKVPVVVNPPQSVDIEFYDSHKYTIHHLIRDYVYKSSMYNNGRSFMKLSDSGSVEKGGISMAIEQFDKNNKSIALYTITGWVASPLNFSGDQSFKAVQNNITFDLLAFSVK